MYLRAKQDKRVGNNIVRSLIQTLKSVITWCPMLLVSYLMNLCATKSWRFTDGWMPLCYWLKVVGSSLHKHTRYFVSQQGLTLIIVRWPLATRVTLWAPNISCRWSSCLISIQGALNNPTLQFHKHWGSVVTFSWTIYENSIEYSLLASYRCVRAT